MLAQEAINEVDGQEQGFREELETHVQVDYLVHQTCTYVLIDLALLFHVLPIWHCQVLSRKHVPINMIQVVLALVDLAVVSIVDL